MRSYSDTSTYRRFERWIGGGSVGDRQGASMTPPPIETLRGEAVRGEAVRNWRWDDGDTALTTGDHGWRPWAEGR
jgi:hypothetical protein